MRPPTPNACGNLVSGAALPLHDMHHYSRKSNPHIRHGAGGDRSPKRRRVRTVCQSEDVAVNPLRSQRKRQSYKSDEERIICTRRSLQLLKVVLEERRNGRGFLNRQPLQLGYGDVEQWLRSRDVCRCPPTADANGNFASVVEQALQARCTCGRLTWKRSRLEDCTTTKPFPPAE